MEAQPKRMQEVTREDTDHRSDSSMSQRGSVRLSNECNTTVILDEMRENGLRENSFNSRSSRCSRFRTSTSLSRDVGDQILHSISLSRDIADQILGGVDSSMIAQVGDSGYPVTLENTNDDNGSQRVSFDDVRCVESGVVTVSDDLLKLSSGSWSRSNRLKQSAPVLPVNEDIPSPFRTEVIHHSNEKNEIQNLQQMSVDDNVYKLPRTLDYLSYLVHLAAFGILGVFTRYLLQKLFGPSCLGLTDDSTLLYLDLPSNVVGSFLMGWIGVVFKADIRDVSDHLVIGLSTGYLGSLTTFSGWNQKMLNLASDGHWVFAIGGIILGMFIVNESIRYGVESAEGLRKSLSHRLKKNLAGSWRVNSFKKHMVVFNSLLFLWIALWVLSTALAGIKLDDLSDGAVLWFACLFGPPGVWIRWYLARLNGRGLGKNGLFKWLPIGTLSANFIAACLYAALSTINKAVNTKRSEILISGIEFGFLGCLSTVSTFVAEVYAMRESGHSGRAVAYILVTFLSSFAIGILIYSVPVWTKNYK